MKRQRWYPNGSFEISLECMGEWKMDCPLGMIEVRSNSGESILRIPSERFHIPYWNAQYCAPEEWNNPLISSEDGKFLCVFWLPKGGGIQSLLLDLERGGGFRLDCYDTPHKISFVPESDEIVLCHHLTPYHADLLLKNWGTDSELPLKVYSGEFETFEQLFGLQNEEVVQTVDSHPYQPAIPSTFSVTSTSFPDLDALLTGRVATAQNDK